MNKTFDNISKEKQNKIIEAAFKEFSLHGYENSSTNRLVKSIGISKGSLYKYFSTKLDLYIYLVNISVSRLLEHFDSNEVKGENWRERILDYSSIEFDFLIKDPVAYRFFYKLVSELESRQLRRVKEDLYKIANDYQKKIFLSIGIPKDNFEFLSSHISFLLKGYNQYYFETLNSFEVGIEDKKSYLSGLKTHLEYVREP
ncbi:MAG: HTH-type transcriptional repressor AcnR [Candidatus Izimaplasma bacterium HR2]|nr:MAG: HTH-type transcriptional repressor AcnR [Candidatus Izimaplasma bacterium HR2]